GGGGGRAVCSGSGGCARLCAARGTDGGALCGQSLWGAGQPVVSHRGPGEVRGGWEVAVLGPSGRAGEDPRLSSGAGRDRGAAKGVYGSAPGGGHGPGGQ